jgi:WD40 repeat protein
VRLFKVADWSLIGEAKGNVDRTIRIVFTRDGRSLITGGLNGEIALWRLDPLRFGSVIGSHQTHVQSLATSPDGTQFVSASDDRTVALWSMDRPQFKGFIGTHSAPINCVAFSPDGGAIAVGSSDHSVRIYHRRSSIWGWNIK